VSFHLDTDICSAQFKRPSGLTHRFILHSGRLFLPTIVLAELHVWAHQRADPSPLLHSIEDDLLRDVTLLDFDRACAEEFGRTRGRMLRQGISVSRLDLMIASVALVHNLTLVTHNTSDYRLIPGLLLDDWLTP
jgi:tRNA(fMet)-specific endonuclease VapC